MINFAIELHLKLERQKMYQNYVKNNITVYL